ncbi:hypothetical protein ACUY3K_04645 [Corynebacterium uberis]|uniref:hypothetical protein n=1 Tax=Corynebacterium TaxID=1716 RepID=UPI0022BA3333|nr:MULTISPECIES: hypothetical protein [Corynebacterium]
MTTASRWRLALRCSAWVSAVFSGAIALYGGWMRRWIADDGLIVLRTVRNILAGNGPVFNAGERVEANTSTVWQYMIAAVGMVSSARLETIAMWLALLCTTAALVIVCLGTAGLYRLSGARPPRRREPGARRAHRVRRRADRRARRRAERGRGAYPGPVVVVPLGSLVYLALPPARDFATSGLEWGLCLLWLAVAWALLVVWSRPRYSGRHGAGAASISGWPVYVLAAWAGLSWLVRPELALYGALIGLLLLATARSVRTVAGICAAALPIPAGYELFRMGYYGLLTPHTAVAKSASGAEWATGWRYVTNLADPYVLWVGLAFVLAAAGVVVLNFSGRVVLPRGQWPQLRRPAVAVGVFALGGLIHLLYVVRVGGDFMHGRMLLLPLFALLAPVSVIPLFDAARPRLAPALGLGLLTFGAWGWSIAAVLHGSSPHTEADPGQFHVVDEREFWTYNTGRALGQPPRQLGDYSTASAMGNFPDAVITAQESHAGMLLGAPVGEHIDQMLWLPLPSTPPTGPSQPDARIPADLAGQRPTIYPTVMGMIGMEAPLDMRVEDTVGLATPLAARQPRMEGARIGHDKALPLAWQIADTATDINSLPNTFDKAQLTAARAALRSPELVELFESYRAPLTWSRFWSNVGFALTQGRHLEISPDPTSYQGQEDPDAQVVWPVTVHLDEPR